VYTSVYVGRPGGFFKRLTTFTKFVFGHRSVCGDFDCFILRNQDIQRLINLLKVYQKDIERIKNKADEAEPDEGVEPEDDLSGFFPK
jgi:hypothetical protein